MKKLLTFITVVIATVVIADILFGIGCRYYVKNYMNVRKLPINKFDV